MIDEQSSEMTSPARLSIEERDLALREKQYDLELKKLKSRQISEEHQLNVIQLQIETSAQDRRDERIHQQKLRSIVSRLYIVLAILVAVVIIVAIFKDKDAMAIEIIKLLTYGTGGYAGGYAVGRFGQSKQDRDDSK